MPDNLQTKTTKLINYAKTQLSSKGVTSTATTLRDALDDISDISTGTTPTGTINITTNGTHDVTNYASANVNVSGLSNDVVLRNQGYTVSINYSRDPFVVEANVFYADGTISTFGENNEAGLPINWTNVIAMQINWLPISAGENSAISLTGASIPIEQGNTYIVNSNLSLSGDYLMCLIEGTLITLANGTTKKIEDITYNDDLLVWDFDNGVFASAKPLWIQIEQEANSYNHILFSDNTELNTINQHRIMNIDSGKFTYPMTNDTPIGTKTFKDNGNIVEVVSKEVINKNVKYYNLMTNYYINCFANGILTSCRLSNLYPINNMQYSKDDRDIIPFDKFDMPYDFYVGLRIGEQPIDINRENADNHNDKTVNDYVNRILRKMKAK